MPDAPVACPLAERHFGEQRRTHPVALHRRRRIGERARARMQARQALLQVVQRLLVEAGADAARVTQLPAALVVNAEQQRAERAARPLRLGVAADHEFLPPRRLQLDPVGRAARSVRGVLALADQPFEPEPVRRLEQALGARIEGLAVADRRRRRCADQRAEHRTALVQRHVAQVVSGEVREVEHEVLQPFGVPAVEGVLQRLEIRRAVRTRHDDLAVDPGRAQAERAQVAHERGQLGRPVVAVARVAAHLRAFDACEQPIAVELDLVQPMAVRGRAIDEHRELRCQHQRQRSRHGVGRQRRARRRAALAVRFGEQAFRQRATFARCSRRPRLAARMLIGAGIARLPRSGAQHAVGHRLHDVELARRPRGGVVVFHQQPRRLPLGAAPLHAHQRPAPFQLAAAQLELQLAGAQAGARVVERRPGAVGPTRSRCRHRIAAAGSRLRNRHTTAGDPRPAPPCA